MVTTANDARRRVEELRKEIFDAPVDVSCITRQFARESGSHLDSYAYVAWHEAGHAIAAHVLGAEPIRVSLWPDSDSTAKVTYLPGTTSWSDDIVIALCGPAAERWFGSQSDYGDMESIWRTAAKVGIDPRTAIQALTPVAERLVRTHKWPVAALAAFLLQNPTLRYENLWRAIDAAMACKEPNESES